MASQAFEQFAEQMSKLNDLVDRKQRELDEFKAAHAKEHEDARIARAEERRQGKQGRAWQVLQQRIDMGETTETDVLNGLDTSAEAREVRAQMTRNLAELRRQIAQMDPDDEFVRKLDAIRADVADLNRREARGPLS